MTTLNKISRIAIPVTMVLLPVLVLAAFPNPTPPVTGGGGAITLNEIERLIGQIATFLIIVGVVLAVIFIIWGGITYMAAAGDPGKAATAKTRIFNGIIGAAVVLGVGVILQTIAGLVARTFFN